MKYLIMDVDRRRILVECIDADAFNFTLDSLQQKGFGIKGIWVEERLMTKSEERRIDLEKTGKSEEELREEIQQMKREIAEIELEIAKRSYKYDLNSMKNYTELSKGAGIKEQFRKVEEEYYKLLEALYNNGYKTSDEAKQEALDLIQATVNLLPMLEVGLHEFDQHTEKKDKYLKNGKYPKEME